MNEPSSWIFVVFSTFLHCCYVWMPLLLLGGALTVGTCQKTAKSGDAKPPAPQSSQSKESNVGTSSCESPITPTKSKLRQKDSFDQLQPRKEEAKRAKQVRNQLAPNQGDYKTWNKYMEESNTTK